MSPPSEHERHAHFLRHYAESEVALHTFVRSLEPTRQMASDVKLPDTSQAIKKTATFGEDSDYTTPPAANSQCFIDDGDGIRGVSVNLSSPSGKPSQDQPW